MDGVLADVSKSYREAILTTAAAFGAPITSKDIAAAKAKGKANNDWVLTHRLITTYKEAHGVRSSDASFFLFGVSRNLFPVSLRIRKYLHSKK